jgi:methylated-DNA-[protein]-cysteine S-methyltransferase
MNKVVVPGPAGNLEIAWADKISSILFTLSEPSSKDNLPEHVTNCIVQLDAYFKGKLSHFELELDVKGTPFQERVWGELCNIEPGTTISYLELARRLGDEKCIRAAASANGKNPFAIVIPCHRVIGANGKLTGYAGGLDKKRWLLAHEARYLAPPGLRLF